ncbi:MAG: ABC transporter ATP-binding protein [Ruminococcaceae bacterium]|nr:ABC transporter ATP-binding protein [Oscillospiraceae bacterium]
MSDILKVENLCKEYPSFRLDNVSFSVKKGTVMGFIGRNGAGKTTTLKAIMNMVHATNGTVEIFGLDIKKHEKQIKQSTGYAGGTVNYYKNKKICRILDITKSFFNSWDDETCKKYLQLFSIDPNKTPSQLSEGMKVKLSLAIALSHNAQLLILDEPTSGLDPVSRAELLEIFKLLKNQGIAILFSTHITSDLENCADDITYIRDGRIIYTGSLENFTCGKKLESVMINFEKEAFYEKAGL